MTRLAIKKDSKRWGKDDFRILDTIFKFYPTNKWVNGRIIPVSGNDAVRYTMVAAVNKSINKAGQTFYYFDSIGESYPGTAVYNLIKDLDSDWEYSFDSKINMDEFTNNILPQLTKLIHNHNIEIELNKLD